MTEEVHIDLEAGTKSSGEPVYERLPALELGDGSFVLQGSPMLVLGLAAGDRVRTARGKFEVISRSGNLAIQVFSADSATVDLIEELLESVGGRLDGLDTRAAVFTVPVAAGFSKIEDLLNSTKADWYYGNVYDTEDGVTPLGWWERG